MDYKNTGRMPYYSKKEIMLLTKKPAEAAKTLAAFAASLQKFSGLEWPRDSPVATGGFVELSPL